MLCQAMPGHARGRVVAYARAETERCVIEAGTYPAVLHTHTHGNGALMVDENSGRRNEQGTRIAVTMATAMATATATATATGGRVRGRGRVRESDVDGSPMR